MPVFTHRAYQLDPSTVHSVRVGYIIMGSELGYSPSWSVLVSELIASV